MATLYDLLGVAPDASSDEIRAAFRRAARAHHPDANGAHASDRMAAVNQAWAVLGHPQRRRDYDRSLADARSGVATPEHPQPVQRPAARAPRFNPLARYQDPPRFPWRLMAVLAVLGSVLVIANSAATSREPADEQPVDRLLKRGDCVRIEPNGDAAEVPCSGERDGVVDALVSDGASCPAGSEPHRDQQGLGVACVVVEE